MPGLMQSQAIGIDIQPDNLVAVRMIKRGKKLSILETHSITIESSKTIDAALMTLKGKIPQNIPVIPVMPDKLQFTFPTSDHREFWSKKRLWSEVKIHLPFTTETLEIYPENFARKQQIKLPALIFSHAESEKLLIALEEQKYLPPPGVFPMATAHRELVRSVLNIQQRDICIADICGSRLCFTALSDDRIVSARVCIRHPKKLNAEISLMIDCLQEQLPDWKPALILTAGEDSTSSSGNGLKQIPIINLSDELTGNCAGAAGAAGAAAAYLTGTMDSRIQTYSRPCFIRPSVIGVLLAVLIFVVSISGNLGLRNSMISSRNGRMLSTLQQLKSKQNTVKDAKLQVISGIIKNDWNLSFSELLSDVGQCSKEGNITLSKIHGSMSELILEGSTSSLSDMSQFIRMVRRNITERKCEIISSDKDENQLIQFKIKLTDRNQD